MEQGCCLLVYPGGAREAWKRTTDKPYEILWGDNHVGFVRMAVRHGYTIVPVATVGTEDVVRPAPRTMCAHQNLIDLPVPGMIRGQIMDGLEV